MLALIAINEQSPDNNGEYAEYSDLQKGYPLLCLLVFTSATTFASTWIVRPPIVATFILIPQLASLVCFCTLFIRVRNGFLFWQFGPGWIRGQVSLSQIVTTRIVMSPFAYGWGFRHSVRGWRFHRGGALAIEIQCRDGKRLRLGTTRAHQLQYFIERARGRRHYLS
jgi:hypothetical protein